MLDGLRQDLTYGIRTLLRGPVTSGAAVISLALGVGVTTAMLGALDVWLLRPLPFPDEDRLVRVYMANWETGWTGNAFSDLDFVDWREASRTVDLAAWKGSGASLAADGLLERVSTLVASTNLLDVLGLRPVLGRGFVADDERDDGARSALISHHFWHNAFGGTSDILGRTVSLDGEPHTVVGVLPPAASFLQFRSDVWVPLRVGPDIRRSGHSLWAVGRLDPGVSMEQAREELGAVAARVAEQDPDRTFPGANVGSFRDSFYGPHFGQGAMVLGPAVLFVLLIACANIGSLILARGARRSGELALRSVLGAHRRRILRQLITENALLAAMGGLLGVGVAWLGLEALARWVLPVSLSADPRLSLDGRFLAIAIGATSLSTLLFGLLPATVASRVDLRGRIQGGTAGGGGRGIRRMGAGLVAGEVALALVLLVSTGLLTRSLASMRGTDLGFRTEGLMSFTVPAPPAGFEGAEGVRDFHRRFQEAVASIPGITDVAAASHAPVGGFSTSLYHVVGSDAPADDARRSAQVRWVSPDYGDLLGMRMVAGSWFDEGADVPDGPPVAVVTRTLAARHWPQPEAALGGRIELGGTAWTVVGVAEDARLLGPGNPTPGVLFRPMARHGGATRTLVAQVPGDRAPVVAAVRRELRRLDPTVALYGVRTVEEQVRSSMGPQVATRRILLTIAGIATVLTLVGIYGVTSHMVGLRTREMGVRLAVGARPGEVLGLVLRFTATVTAWGLAAGIAVSLATGELLSFALVGVDPRDPVVLGTVAALVGAAALAAALRPALRAARVDPVRALRAE